MVIIFYKIFLDIQPVETTLPPPLPLSYFSFNKSETLKTGNIAFDSIE